MDQQGGKRSRTFLIKLGCNLLLLVVLGLVLYWIFPEQMLPVLELYGVVFGPLVIVVLVLAALPRKED